MSGHTKGSAQDLPFRKCWRASELSDAVLYHGRYQHTFIHHSHDVLTFILVTDGAVDIDIDNRRYRVEKGQFVTIGANQIHGARPADSRGWRMRSLHLFPETLARRMGMPLDDARHLHFLNPVHEGTQSIGSSFFDIHYCSQTDGDVEGRQYRFECFMDRLILNIEELQPEVRVPDGDSRVFAARRLLNSSLQSRLLMENVAEEVGLSPFTLIRSFRKNFGISPHYWRMQVRANAVSNLLRDECSLAEATYSCGFADQSHMTRVFKKVFGVTPGQYRAIHVDHGHE